MQLNKVKQRMRAGEIAFGTYVSLREPAIVELLGLAGLDAAAIDMEHTSIELPLIEDMVRAAEVVGITPTVRVPDLDPKLILRLLDIGVQGIQVPHVKTAEEAVEAVKAVKYFPVGERGAMAGARAARYSVVPWLEHIKSSNEEILVSLMIEDPEGISNVEKIAAVEGVDLVLLGPSDLAESLGIPEPNDPKLWATVEDIARRIKKVGNAKMALSSGHPQLTASVADLKRLGVGYSNLLPPPEEVILEHYRDKLAQLRG